MAVHDLGYRGWSGRLVSPGTRWTVIAGTGVRLAWQSRWLRRMLFFAWLPALWFALGFFIFEQSTLRPEWRDAMTPFLLATPSTARPIVDAMRADDSSTARHLVWGWLLHSFFRYPQGVIMVLVVGLIGPPLVSQDIRSRAFLLYFSRPLTSGEYMLGKLATIWFYLATIATTPALSLYVLGVLLSPNLEVVQATWDLPLRILAASAVLMIPTATLALCFSSLTQESRYASFAWFAVWIIGWFTYGLLVFAETVRNEGVFPADTTKWSYFSLYHTLGRVQSWVFGFAEFDDTKISAAILVVVTVVSTLILLRRVSAPMRA
jgi:hypothetical protein